GSLATEEPPRRPPEREPATIWLQTKSGFTMLWRDPVLRTVTLSSSIVTVFAQFQMAVYFLFLNDDLHLRPGVIGALFSVSGAFGFLGAVASDRLARRFGIGRLIVAGQLIQSAGGLLLAVAGGSQL